MGLFSKPLLPAHYENEDVQVSAELCTNITINVVGLARGDITVLSANEDMIHIKASVKAKESILKNAVALEPVQDGDSYTYTIHTPLEENLGKSVAFQVFVTIPKNLDSLESFTIHGANLELSIGNISHTFIKSLTVNSDRGDIAIDSFYGESAFLKSTVAGSISGKYSVARLYVNAKSGKIQSNVHLLNTDESQPDPKVVCTALYHPINVSVDGSDLFSPFTVEAMTQCKPLDVKILLASEEQRFLGNFINFGAPIRIKLSGNYQGRIETRAHYGDIIIDEPEFKQIEGAMLTIPSLSDRNAHGSRSSSNLSSSSSSTASSTRPSTATSSHGGSTVWDRDDPRHHQSYLSYPYTGNGHANSKPATAVEAGARSRANSISGSISETRSIGEARSVCTTKSEKERKKKDDKDFAMTKKVIGTIGHGSGLIVAKNSSGDITLHLI